MLYGDTDRGQIMACCLTALNHYLNQCWRPITEGLFHLPENIFIASGQVPELLFCITSLKITATIKITATATSLWGHWVILHHTNLTTLSIIHLTNQTLCTFFYPVYNHIITPHPLQWHHKGHGGISNHQPQHCSLNSLFRRRSKKTSKLCITGLCAGNSPVNGEYPAQRASNAENVSIWWCIHMAMFPSKHNLLSGVGLILQELQWNHRLVALCIY